MGKGRALGCEGTIIRACIRGVMSGMPTAATRAKPDQAQPRRLASILMESAPLACLMPLVMCGSGRLFKFKDYPYRTDDGRDEIDRVMIGGWCAAGLGTSIKTARAVPTATTITLTIVSSTVRFSVCLVPRLFKRDEGRRRRTEGVKPCRSHCLIGSHQAKTRLKNWAANPEARAQSGRREFAALVLRSNSQILGRAILWSWVGCLLWFIRRLCRTSPVIKRLG